MAMKPMQSVRPRLSLPSKITSKFTSQYNPKLTGKGEAQRYLDSYWFQANW